MSAGKVIPGGLLGLVPWILIACGGAQARMGDVFDKAWRDDGGASISSLHGKLASHTIPRGADVALGVVEEGLVGVALATGQAWSYLHAVDARPWIAGNVVVGTGGGRVFALDALTGRPLWSRPATGRVSGAGDDGRTTLVSFEASFRGDGVLVAVARDGTVTRQLEMPVRIGTPALVANLAFFPWEERNVTAYDLGSGREVARTILAHSTSHAFIAGGTLFFGQETVTAFDGRIGAQGAPTVTLPNRELPGDPSWLGPSGVGKVTSTESDVNRLYGKPVWRGDALGFAGDRYYGTYRRFVMGLEATTGGLAWVRRTEADSLGGAAYDGGVVLCEGTGAVRFYEGSTGALAGKVSLGVRVRACVVQADGLSRRAEPRREPLIDQLSGGIDVLETGAGAMQSFLLSELVALESPEATRRLIEMAMDSRTPPGLMTEVRAGLSSRRNGAEFMLEALDSRYDFLAGVLVTPPVGPLADALAQMGEGRAAPLLAEHLNDPANSTDDVKRSAQALAKLATAEEFEQLETFFALNRATAHNEDILTAVVAVAGALLRVGGGAGREIVRSAAYDSMTVPMLQQPLRELAGGTSTTGRLDH